MQTNEIGLIKIVDYKHSSNVYNLQASKPCIIVDKLEDCAVSAWIVKESPETVETWRETQEKLAESDNEIAMYLASIRPKMKPKTILK
jgi:hypothetical protein